MQQYHPRVQCSPRIRPAGSLNPTACQILLDQMLTTTSSQTFGTRGDPGVDVPLGQRFASRMSSTHSTPGTITILTASAASGDCSITLLMDGPPVRMTWHEIWGAAVAVAGMCVREAKLGTATLQCRSHKISTDLDSHADSLTSRAFQDQCRVRQSIHIKYPSHLGETRLIKDVLVEVSRKPI